MKDWFGMIGHRIELLSGVNFEAMISESGGADPTREGLATVIRMLEERFGQCVFYARDVARDEEFAPVDEETPAAAKPAWTQEDVERLRDAMQAAIDVKEETARSRWPSDNWTSQRIGRRLRELADRPVLIDHCTMTLRMQSSPDKLGAKFFIEIDI